MYRNISAQTNTYPSATDQKTNALIYLFVIALKPALNAEKHLPAKLFFASIVCFPSPDDYFLKIRTSAGLKVNAFNADSGLGCGQCKANWA